MARALQIPLEHIEDWDDRAVVAKWRVKALAKACDADVRTLQRFWRHTRQMCLSEWLKERRFSLACALLQTTQLTIKEVALLCGYGHIGAFSFAFAQRFHYSPRAWRMRIKAAEPPLGNRPEIRSEPVAPQRQSAHCHIFVNNG